MENAFFKTEPHSFGFAFHGNQLDRVSERRDDAAFLAELRRRPDARAVLIARDMPILTRGEPREAGRGLKKRVHRRSRAMGRAPPH